MNKEIFKKWWVWGIVVIILFPLIWYFIGYVSWWFGNSDLRSENRALKELYTSINNDKVELENAYKNDFDGGKTPQETWDMFVNALKKGDTEQASKYFVVEKQIEWNENISTINKNKLLHKMVDDLTSNYKILGLTEANDFRYIKKNKEGTVVAELILILNPYTKIWKIKSL
jgi:hypothetical protein